MDGEQKLVIIFKKKNNQKTKKPNQLSGDPNGVQRYYTVTYYIPYANHDYIQVDTFDHSQQLRAMSVPKLIKGEPRTKPTAKECH